MKEITEDYVSFEIAKLLKAKRFNEKCLRTYFGDGKMSRIFDDYEEIYNENLLPSVVAAPTLQMAMKWLREKHKLFVDVAPNVEYYIKKNEVKYRKPYYTFVISSLTSGEPITYSQLTEKYKSYEEVCEAAIKYVLENLI